MERRVQLNVEYNRDNFQRPGAIHVSIRIYYNIYMSCVCSALLDALMLVSVHHRFE